MNRIIASVVFGGLMIAASQTMADDMGKQNMSKSAMMKDCMTRMKAKNDGSTKAQMKAACKAEMKNAMGSGSETSKDGMDTPKQ